MEIIEQLNWRYAVKSFDPDKKLSPEQELFLKEVLQLSPSSFGLQGWKFVFVKNPDLRSKIQEHAWNQSQVVEASHLIVLCRPAEFDEADVDKLIQATHSERGTPMESLTGYKNVVMGFVTKFSAEEKKAWLNRQIYIALGQLMSLCALKGIDTCPMEGFDPQGVDKVLDLENQKLESVVMCAVGFRGDDKYAKLKKVRYPISDVVIELS